MGLLGNMVILFLTFHTLQYINIRVTLINISTNSIQGVPYLYIQALLPFLFLIVILTSDTPLQFWFPFDDWLSTSGSSGIISSSSESQYSYILPFIWKAGKQRGRRNGNVRVRHWSSTQWFTSLNGHKQGSVRLKAKAWNLLQSSHVGGRDWTIWALLLLSQMHQQGSGSEAEQLETELVT